MYFYPTSSWFLLAKRERNHCEHAPVRHAPRDVLNLNIICKFIFSLEVFRQKNADFSPKALTKVPSKPPSKNCIYLVWGLNIKYKFKVFFPAIVRDCWALIYSYKTPNNSKQYEFNWGRKIVSRFVLSFFKRLDVNKIKNRKAHKATKEEFQRCTATS